MPDISTTEERSKAFERVFDSQIVRMIVSVGVFCTAALLLAYKDDVTKCWPLVAWPGFGGRIVWSALIYWTGSLALLGIGICQYVATDKKNARTKRNQQTEKEVLNNSLSGVRGQLSEVSGQLGKLKDEKEAVDKALSNVNSQLEKVKDELKTLPGGPAFREQFALRADDLQLLLSTALSGSSDRPSLELGLLSLVAGMAHLASLYGPTGANVCYAYAMKFVKEPSDTECELVHMVASGTSFDRTKGLLLSVPELAAKMTGGKDTRSQTFALATVAADKIDSLSDVFGPQKVFASKDVAGMAEIRQFLDTNPATDSSTLAFTKVYKAQPWAFGKSFISLPLCVNLGNSLIERIGVLMITSDGPKIMGGIESRWEIFWMMMRPYTDGIALLLKMWLNLGEK